MRPATTAVSQAHDSGVVRVAVRVIPFAVGQRGLEVALTHAPHGAMRLPGRDLTANEPLDACAARIAEDALGTRPDYLEQLYTFSAPAPRDAVIVAYFALLSAQTQRAVRQRAEARFVHVDDELPLPAAERMMLDYAKLRLRGKLDYSNIGFHFLPPEFTLSDLQDVYESVIGRKLDKRNFRRRVLAAQIVEPVGAKRAGTHYRPAALYRFAGGDPASGALTPTELERSEA
jgi:8-oxo-dGTP diphosphatase